MLIWFPFNPFSMHCRYLPSFLPFTLSSFLSLFLSSFFSLSCSFQWRMEVLIEVTLYFEFHSLTFPLIIFQSLSLAIRSLWNLHLNGSIVFIYTFLLFKILTISKYCLSIVNNYNKEVIQRERVWMVKKNAATLKGGELLIYSFHSFYNIACKLYLISQLVYISVIYLNGFTELTTGGTLYRNNSIT